jgi:hypothetical protein
MTDKRFVSEDDCCGYYTVIIDNEKELDLSLPNPKKNLTIEELMDLLNSLNDENEELKQSVNNLKDTIIKITIAYQRKYDRNIVDLVHEIHEEDISDLIKELKE